MFVLIDSRHGIKAVDDEIMELLDEAAVTYQVVLTKIDKIKPPAVAKSDRSRRGRAEVPRRRIPGGACDVHCEIDRTRRSARGHRRSWFGVSQISTVSG